MIRVVQQFTWGATETVVAMADELIAKWSRVEGLAVREQYEGLAREAAHIIEVGDVVHSAVKVNTRRGLRV